MEHAQRDYGNNTLVRWSFNVLILILMEHAQRERVQARFSAVADGS